MKNTKWKLALLWANEACTVFLCFWNIILSVHTGQSCMSLQVERETVKGSVVDVSHKMFVKMYSNSYFCLRKGTSWNLIREECDWALYEYHACMNEWVIYVTLTQSTHSSSIRSGAVVTFVTFATSWDFMLCCYMWVCICLDINECDEGTSCCEPGLECVNSIGTYSCRCNSGFKQTANGCGCVGK